MSQISRRDFLKLASAISGGVLLSTLKPQFFPLSSLEKSKLPSIIVIVLDAMTAENLSIYGYHRKTTPNFERFAKRATVFHNHSSAGNYTVPGTASLLTGLYPWTHRALNLSGLVVRELANRNIFSLLHSQYHRFAYSQNIAANQILNQFENSIDTYLSPGKFSVAEQILSCYPYLFLHSRSDRTVDIYRLLFQPSFRKNPFRSLCSSIVPERWPGA